MRVTDIEVVEDLTAGSRCDEGFLRVRRLQVRNVYEDGSRSEPYACDVLSRRDVDAVAVVLHQVDEHRVVRVVLKDGVRPVVHLRKHKELVRDDELPYLTVTEIAAGVLERKDGGAGGVARRAAAEALEECGLEVDPADVLPLGGAMCPSPGVADEKVFFRSAAVDPASAMEPSGDGSPMEEGTRAVVLELKEAIALCRRGEIPDMKTEIGLLRLADHLGYLPQLGVFVHELPQDLRERYSRLGIDEPQGDA